MLKNIGHRLNEEIKNSYSMFDYLRTKQDEWRFKFLKEQDFKALPHLGKTAQVYWFEMLQRVHIIVLVSSFKMLRWFDSADDCYSNYYGFCASLRGLVESCADAYYTLRQVPLTLATDFRVIYEQLGERSPVLTYHEELENELLHYLQATKLTSDQKKVLPRYLEAKHVTDYVKEIDGGDGDIIALYGRLCGISHPSSESTRTLLFEHEGETIVCCDSAELERQLVEVVLDRESETITKMFRVVVASAVSTILLLNRFDVPKIRLDVSFEESFLSTDIWDEIATKMKMSEEKYKVAVSSGKYV